MTETGSAKGQNFVRGETNTLELAKLGQAVNLRVYRNGKMKGRMLVGHGAVGWIPRGWVKTKRKSIPWEVFATMMKEWPFGGRAQARLKFVDGALRWRSPGKGGAGRRISWAELTARLDAPMTAELKAELAKAKQLIRDEQRKALARAVPRKRKADTKKARQLARIEKEVEAEKERLLAEAKRQVEDERKRLSEKARQQVAAERRRLLADAKRQVKDERERLMKAARKSDKEKETEKKKTKSKGAGLAEQPGKPTPEPVLIAGLREAMGDMAYVSCPVENGDILRLKRPPKRGPNGKVDVSLNNQPGGWVDARGYYQPTWTDRQLVDRMVTDLQSFVANPEAWIEFAWKGENRCVVCGRGLIVPLSQKLGIGPKCRKKYGSADALKALLARRAAARRRAAEGQRGDQTGKGGWMPPPSGAASRRRAATGQSAQS